MVRNRFVTLLLLSGIGLPLAVAQDKPAEPGHFYKLTFRVLESQGNGSEPTVRMYSEVISVGESNKNEMKSGDKVPLITGSFDPNNNGRNNIQYQYLEVGTDIETSASSEEGGEIRMNVRAVISSVVNLENGTTELAKSIAATKDDPVIRQSNWDSRVTVPIGKPTIIFSSDNVNDKGKTELELTATPIK